jgi:aryl-alcohol dehydrogenase-like predicted oxidoreductase
MIAFRSVCRLAAVQLRYNMLQREIERDVVPWCLQNGVGVFAYWPLMKGLLAGRFARDHVFEPNEPRLKYAIFRGRLWEENQTFLDALRSISQCCGRTISQIVLNWTIHRPGITSALCGARRPDQIVENAGADGWRLDPQDEAKIETAYRLWSERTMNETLAT